MTPKEKAEELVLKFEEYSDSADERGFAVKCALIAVDEIINASPTYPWAKDVGAKAQGLYENVIFPTNYWRDVKSEILQLNVQQLNKQ
jgi:hypothetical protein